jgi:hypothetical protein
MTIVNQIYVIAYGRNSRKPEDVSVGILTKKYESIDDVFKKHDEAEVTRYGDYPRPSHYEKGFYYAVKKESVIALTHDLTILDKVMSVVAQSNVKVCDLRADLQSKIIELVK